MAQKKMHFDNLFQWVQDVTAGLVISSPALHENLCFSFFPPSFSSSQW